MALENFQGAPLQRTLFRGIAGAVRPKFWRTGIAFLAIYLVLNVLTEWHEFDRLGITLWSPDNGLSFWRYSSKAPGLPRLFSWARFFPTYSLLGFKQVFT